MDTQRIKKQSKIRPFLRFNPDDSEHIKWMEENKNKSEIKYTKPVMDKRIESESSSNEDDDPPEIKKLKVFCFYNLTN